MMRTALLFFVLCLCGIVINATLVHALFPAAIAPDFTVLLVVCLAIRFPTARGMIGAFLLGILADFASGEYLGPNAAGAVVAFSVVVFLSDKIYADRGGAIFVISFFGALAKSVMYALMLVLYLHVSLFTVEVAKLVALEALITGVLAPFIVPLIIGGARNSKRHAYNTSRSYSWSTSTR